MDMAKTDCMQLGLHLHEAAEWETESQEMKNSNSKAAYAPLDVATAISPIY